MPSCIARLGAAVLSLLLELATPASAQEPDIAGGGAVLLRDDFESPEWYRAWGLSKAPRNVSVARDSPFRGSSHLRVAVHGGDHYGGSFGFDFAEMGLPELDEAYFRYAIRLGPTWTAMSGGGKLPGFGATYDTAGWGGRPSDGTNGWSARGAFRPPPTGRGTGATKLGFYVYHADMNGTYGDSWLWCDGSGDDDAVLERGRWYEIEGHVRNNTPGRNDGVLRAWVDGALVFERRDVRFRDVESLHVERVWFDVYYGGSFVAPHGMHVDFDSVVIARSYVGPAREETSPPSSEPPGDGGAHPVMDDTPGNDPGSCRVETATGDRPLLAGAILQAGVLVLLGRRPRRDRFRRPARAPRPPSRACGTSGSSR